MELYTLEELRRTCEDCGQKLVSLFKNRADMTQWIAWLNQPEKPVPPLHNFSRPWERARGAFGADREHVRCSRPVATRRRPRTTAPSATPAVELAGEFKQPSPLCLGQWRPR